MATDKHGWEMGKQVFRVAINAGCAILSFQEIWFLSVSISVYPWLKHFQYYRSTRRVCVE
jgi:hypothetical protein